MEKRCRGRVINADKKTRPWRGVPPARTEEEIEVSGAAAVRGERKGYGNVEYPAPESRRGKNGETTLPPFLVVRRSNSAINQQQLLKN